MALEKYNAKRDFKKTAEPAGKLQHTKGGFSYLIQKHAASRLHYDFRLELDGVLKSWAVTKGPSLDPADRRLAVEVEDHPVSYGSFEGIIPKGQYGGGTVMMWDQGTWEPLDDPRQGLKTGHLHFKLHGKRLQGEWALVRMKQRMQDKGRNNWLLIKKSDEYAQEVDKGMFLTENNTSITTKRSMDEIAEQKKNVWQSNRAEVKQEKAAPKKTSAVSSKSTSVKPKKKSAKLPEFIEPQLATLSDAMPSGKNWVHEIKFDGYRTFARIENGKTIMLTRRGLDWTHKFKAVANELKKLGVNAMIDGEVIALNPNGNSSFMELQKALTDGRTDELQYYAFDLLYLDGEDLRGLTLLERKEKLQALLAKYKFKSVFYSEHFTNGQGFLEKACELDLEGVISKKADDIYHSGRGKSWLKSKCHKRQEFVIGGYTLPSNGMAGVGALLVGYYEDGKLIYASKCGTGFDNKTSLLIRKKLEGLKTKENPFTKVTTLARRGAIWVKPKLVCEIEFTEWTGDGALRHPSFQGLREDKPPHEVGRDKAIHLKTNAPKEKPMSKSKIAAAKTASAVTKSSATKSAAKPTKVAVDKGEKLTIAGINISHPDRVLYPKQGITKGEVAKYYEAVRDYILPYISNHLISTIRCQQDINNPCFFQRHPGTSANKFLKGMKVKGHGDNEPYMAIDSKEGLISLVQNGIVEIHPWGSPMEDVFKPDRIIFDLDPDTELDWKYVVEAAQTMRKKLEELGLESYLKTTGGKGLHVTVPMKPKYTWDVMKPWAKALAESMVRDEPKKYTANMSKAGRKGKIFIDYLRNGATATAIAPYALRARDGATAALPIDWKELSTKLDPKKFNLNTVPDILKKRKKDPWEGFYKSKQSISVAMLKAYGIKPE